MPDGTYNPPALSQDKLPTGDIYGEGYAHRAVVMCWARHENYFHYVVDEVLKYPHSYDVSPMTGLFETDILVENWTSFEMPYNCELLSWEDVNAPPEANGSLLASAFRRILNLTKDPSDRELLEQWANSVSSKGSSGRFSTNSTLVHGWIMTSDVYKTAGTPFVLVWTMVVLLGIAGAVVSRKDKVLLVGFIVLLMLGLIFVGKYLVNEKRKADGWKAFDMLMSLKPKSGSCGYPVAGVGAPLTPEGVSEMLATVNRTDARILGVKFQDDIIQVAVGVTPGNASYLLEEFSKKGWDVSSVLEDLPEKEQEWYSLINQTKRLISLLEINLNNLPPEEQKVLQRFIEDQKKSLRNMEHEREINRECVSVSVVYNNPEVEYAYPGFSKDLSKIGLIVVGLLLPLELRRRE